MAKFALSKKKVEEPFSHYKEQLNDAKSQIDNIENQTVWDSKKKLANPYEMITSNYKRSTLKVVYHPFSRAYFKMWEIIKDYSLLPSTVDGINVACLAEGPGGFMEAVANSRRCKEDKIIGITLPAKNYKTPGWEKYENSISYKNEYVKTCLQVNYGDLYNLPDILKYAELFQEKKAWLVTGDGGFDFSNDYNQQESMALKLIFAELLTALTIQEMGGHFVCKVFDLFSTITLQVMFLIYLHYDEMYIVKPKVSRPANSEKYVVAKGFRGVDPNVLHNLYELLVRWDSDMTHIEGLDLTPDFINSIDNINKSFVNQQISFINKSIKLVNNSISKYEYNKILDKQRELAIEWCDKYGVKYKLL